MLLIRTLLVKSLQSLKLITLPKNVKKHINCQFAGMFLELYEFILKEGRVIFKGLHSLAKLSKDLSKNLERLNDFTSKSMSAENSPHSPSI